MISLIIGIMVSLVVTIVGTPLLIKLVHKLNYGQYIRQDGPKSHLVKRGTPTLGGVVINLAVVLGWCSSALYRFLTRGEVPSWSAVLVLFAMLSMGFLGFIDDFAKVRKKQSEGLTVKGKFIGQFILATIYAVLALILPTKSGFPSAQAGMSFIEKPFFSFEFAGRVVAIVLFVLVLMALLYLAVAGFAGKWVAQNVVAPLLDTFSGGSSGSAPSQGPGASAGATASAAEQTQQEVSVPSIRVECVQLGLFSSKENAGQVADGSR